MFWTRENGDMHTLIWDIVFLSSENRKAMPFIWIESLNIIEPQGECKKLDVTGSN
jgi:hypothetical protein